MECTTFTPYTGLDPNDQTLTAEQKMQACMSYRDYIMNTFVPEMNAAMPQICASGQVKLENYVGEVTVCLKTDINTTEPCETQGTYMTDQVVSYSNPTTNAIRYYRSLKDNNAFVVAGWDNENLYNTVDWQELPIAPMYGSNANGSWFKFWDGLLIQYVRNKYLGSVAANQTVVAGVGVGFPVAFVGEYGVTVDCSQYGNGYGSVSRVFSHNPTYCRADFHLQVGTSVNAGDLRGGYIAIGRWK